MPFFQTQVFPSTALFLGAKLGISLEDLGNHAITERLFAGSEIKVTQPHIYPAILSYAQLVTLYSVETLRLCVSGCVSHDTWKLYAYCKSV